MPVNVVDYRDNNMNVRIKHATSGTLIADGPLGWGITPFEGNKRHKTKALLRNGPQ